MLGYRPRFPMATALPLTAAWLDTTGTYGPLATESARALKILQVAAPAEAGGLERVVETLAVGLHGRGHDVSVATLLLGRSADHPFVQALQGTGVRLHLLPMAPRDYLRERRELRALFAAVRPDVVHTHGYRIDLLNRGIVAGLGIPTVTTVHGASMQGGAKGKLFEWLQRMNYRRFDAVVAVSRQACTSARSQTAYVPRVSTSCRTRGSHDESRWSEAPLGAPSDWTSDRTSSVGGPIYSGEGRRPLPRGVGPHPRTPPARCPHRVRPGNGTTPPDGERTGGSARPSGSARTCATPPRSFARSTPTCSARDRRASRS